MIIARYSYLSTSSAVQPPPVTVAEGIKAVFYCGSDRGRQECAPSVDEVDCDEPIPVEPLVYVVVSVAVTG